MYLIQCKNDVTRLNVSLLHLRQQQRKNVNHVTNLQITAIGKLVTLKTEWS